MLPLAQLQGNLDLQTHRIKAINFLFDKHNSYSGTDRLENTIYFEHGIDLFEQASEICQQCKNGPQTLN